MNDLIKLALLLATRGQTGVAARKPAAILPLGLFALGCALAAFICGLVAIWRYGDFAFGRIGAPLIVAGVLCVACAVAVIVMRCFGWPRRAPTLPAPSPEQLVSDASALVKANKMMALAAAALAGFIAANSVK